MVTINPRSSTPYWNVNIPPTERSIECPPYLQNLGPKDIAILSTPDSDYHILSWPEVQDVIAKNKLDLFQRIPSDLRRYLAYNYSIKQQHGSVMNYVLQHKLNWPLSTLTSPTPSSPSSNPFSNPSNYTIKWNDWPYGIDRRIVHLVVWTKFQLEEDPATTDISDQARSMVTAFVDRTFVDRCGRENVIWFRNWSSLKSVHAVEHFHVMLFDPDLRFVEEITGGDVAVGLVGGG